MDGGDLSRSQSDTILALRKGQGLTYDDVADKNLQDLGLQTRPPSEDLLQNADKQMADWRADERAVQAHLGYSRVEVVATLAAVMRDPRSKEFLEGEEGSGGEHLGAQGVRLELPQIRLHRESMSVVGK